MKSAILNTLKCVGIVCPFKKVADNLCTDNEITRYCLFDDVLYFQIKCHTLKERKQTAKCHLTCNKSAYLDRLAMKEMIMDLHYCIEARSIKHFSPNLCSLFFAYENRISLNHWLHVS